MSNYDGYRTEDNARRKARNTGDELEGFATNKNVKAWSSKPGQMSCSQQATYIANQAKRLSKMQDCKHFTKEEIDRLNAERGFVKPVVPVELTVAPAQEEKTMQSLKAQIEHLESLGFTPAQIIAILKMKEG